MAGNAVVGSLRISLGLDSAQFQTGLKNAQTGLQRFAGFAKTAGLAIGTALLAAGGVVAVAMKGIIDEADKMSKLSQSLGVPIEELSKLAYAAQLADVDIDALSKGLKRLSAGMLDSTESATGPAARAFAMLGVSATDASGKLRPANQVLEALADRFAKLEDGPAKTAIAMRLFGKSGADMIPLLNEGSAGLREMYAEAEELGIVLDEETGRAAEAFNDNLTRLGKVKDGIVTKITAGMLPALASMTNGLVVVAKNSDLLKRVGGALGRVIQFLATAAVTAGGFFVALAQDIGMAAKAAYLWSTGNMASAMVVITEGNARREQTLAGIRAINAAIWAPAPAGGSSFETAASDLEDLDTSANGARRSVERLTDAEREAKRAAEELVRDGERTFDETRTAAERYAIAIERLNRQLAGGAINQDTFNRKLKELNNELEAATRVEPKIAPKTDPWRERQDELAADMRADLEAATYDGIRGGLEAAADGNLGEYLANRIRAALMDNLADVLTNAITGGGKKGAGGGAMGWLNAAGSMLKSFANGIPGFAKGVENFGGGLAYVHAGEVLTNLPKGTDVISAKDVRAGGGSGSPLHFDLRGAVMTSDLLAQMEGMAAQGAQVSVQTSRQAVPADMAKTGRYSLGRR